MLKGRLGDVMMLATCFHDIFMANVLEQGVPPRQRGAPLSPRERQCLEMAARGLTSGDIGTKLGIAERTANFHFSNLISKLGVLNRHEAIARTGHALAHLRAGRAFGGVAIDRFAFVVGKPTRPRVGPLVRSDVPHDSSSAITL